MSFSPSKLANPGIEAIQPYVHSRDPVHDPAFAGSNLLKLGSNENPFGASPLARDAAVKEANRLERYPDGGGSALRSELADRLDLPPEQIVLGNGSNEILELAAHICLAPGKLAATFAHSFAVYKLAAQARGADFAEAPLDNWRQTASSLVALCKSTTPQVIFFATPANPTGSAMPQHQVEAITQAFPETLVVLDLAYAEYADAEYSIDIRALVLQYPNLVITRTFSKVHGLAALRIGYGVMSVELAQMFGRVRQPFNANQLAQAAALASLSDIAYLDKCIDDCRAVRTQLQGWLDDRTIGYLPSQANFVAIKAPHGDGDTFTARLEEQGVVARSLVPYGMKEYTRLTIPRSQDAGTVIRALQDAAGQERL